ncbi:MAG: hypothetical protein WC379_16745 [Methanoregula sp.]|jgi:hypothetical protein
MTENPLLTRAAICGAGILGAIIVILAHLPLVLLVVPVVILFLGIVADPFKAHAAWYGALNTVGIFDPAVLNNEEKENYAGNRHYFWFGEIASAAMLAGAITVPLGMFLAEKTGSLLSFTIAAMLFLLLFVFLPRLIRQRMMTDKETIIQLFGKNEQVKKVFWSVFIVLAGFVLAQVVDPVTAQQIVGIITGAVV